MRAIPPPKPQDELAPIAITNDFPRRPWRDPEDGRPFFPLAWFSYQSDEQDLDDLAREGTNLVLFVNSPSDLDTDEQLHDNSERMKRYLDHAQQRNIKVLVQLAGWYRAHIRRRRCRDRAPTAMDAVGMSPSGIVRLSTL